MKRGMRGVEWKGERRGRGGTQRGYKRRGKRQQDQRADMEARGVKVKDL